jgi:FkbM family methyltransferase
MYKKIIVQNFLQVLPRKLSLLIARISPRFSRNLPLDIKGLFTYSSVFKVELNSYFPIEREMMSGTYEQEITRTLIRLLNQGDCVIDIGANVGALSLLASKLVGSSGKVISIEPGQLTHDRFRLTIERNSIKNIHLLKIGISDEPGILTWNMDPSNPGNACLLDTSDGEKIDVHTLDSVVSELLLSSVKLIKIDVEGMELKCLTGGLKTITEFKPIVIFETLEAFVDTNGYGHIDSLEKFFLDRGYNIFEVDTRGIRQANGRSKTSNTIAIHESDATSLNKI